MLPAGNPGLAAINILRARLALARAVRQEAAVQTLRALALYSDTEASAPLRAQALALVTQMQLQQGDAPASLVSAQHAVQLARTAFGGFPTGAPLGRALLVLGQAQRATGQADAVRRNGLKAQLQLGAAAGRDAPLAVPARNGSATF